MIHHSKHYTQRWIRPQRVATGSTPGLKQEKNTIGLPSRTAQLIVKPINNPPPCGCHLCPTERRRATRRVQGSTGRPGRNNSRRAPRGGAPQSRTRFAYSPSNWPLFRSRRGSQARVPPSLPLCARRRRPWPAQLQHHCQFQNGMKHDQEENIH